MESTRTTRASGGLARARPCNHPMARRVPRATLLVEALRVEPPPQVRRAARRLVVGPDAVAEPTDPRFRARDAERRSPLASVVMSASCPPCSTSWSFGPETLGHLRDGCWSAGRRVRGHISVCVLAAVIEAVMARDLRQAKVADPDLLDQHLSARRALRELDRVRMIQFTDAAGNKRRVVTRPSALQSQILAAVGVDTSAWRSRVA